MTRSEHGSKYKMGRSEIPAGKFPAGIPPILVFDSLALTIGKEKGEMRFPPGNSRREAIKTIDSLSWPS